MNKFLKKNAPTILTIAGSIGVMGTSLLVAKETPKAIKIINQRKRKTRKDKLHMALEIAKVYSPAIISGVSTIFCICSANILNERKQASLISAYTLLSNTYAEYQEEISSLLSSKVNSDIKKQIVKGHIRRKKELINSDLQIFYDEFSGTEFESVLEDVISAQHELNSRLQKFGSVSVNEYYELLGIPELECGDILGWSENSGCSKVEFANPKCIMDDGLEIYISKWLINPVLNFNEF